MKNAVYYKVSYVVEGGRFPGTIVNTKQEPRVGDEVAFNGRLFTIVEIMELMPPAGNEFGFLHATCRYIRDV
jgi:hypothetical protein